MIGLLSKNLDLFQTAGDEDVNTTLTVEQVEEDLRDYHAYHPSEYDTFMEKGLVYREVAERMYEKRRIIQARKKRLANAVSIFYDIEIILLLLITDFYLFSFHIDIILFVISEFNSRYRGKLINK